MTKKKSTRTSDQLQIVYKIYPRNGKYVQMEPRLLKGAEDITDELGSKSALASVDGTRYNICIDDQYTVLISEGRNVINKVSCADRNDAEDVIDILRRYGSSPEICLDPKDLAWADKAKHQWDSLKEDVQRLRTEVFVKPLEAKYARQQLVHRIKRLFSLRRKNNDTHA